MDSPGDHSESYTGRERANGMILGVAAKVQGSP
jgi:hypothetical protein